MSLWWLWLGCAGQGDGTFVGNPELTARYVGSPTTRAGDGSLVAPEIRVDDCMSESPNLGPVTFQFVDGRSTEGLPIPETDGCGLRVVVTGMTIGFRTDAGEYQIQTEGFDLEVPDSFIANRNQELVLGGADWLDTLAETVPPGTYTTESDPLRTTFFDGLLEDSSIQIVNEQ